MSNVEDRVETVNEARAMQARYESAVEEIKKFRRIEAGQSGALVFAAMAYGDALDSSKMFQVASHWARLFCIAAVFVIPNLLVIRVLM